MAEASADSSGCWQQRCHSHSTHRCSCCSWKKSQVPTRLGDRQVLHCHSSALATSKRDGGAKELPRAVAPLLAVLDVLENFHRDSSGLLPVSIVLVAAEMLHVEGWHCC